MSYLTYEYQFSQFDKDAIPRGHADYLIYAVKEKLPEAQGISYESPDATSSLNQAQTTYNSGLNAYSSQGYKDAISQLTTALGLVDKAFTAETSLIQGKIESIGKLECPQAQTLVQKAADELAAANRSYQVDDYRSAYRHLQVASLSVGQAKTMEQDYQQAKSVVDEAQLKINAVGKLESPRAIATLQKAKDELALARASFEKRDYTSVYQHTQASSIYAEQTLPVEQVYLAEKQKADTQINEAQLKINAAGSPESTEAAALLQKAREELEVAKSSFENGNHSNAYEHAQASSIYAYNARTIEQIYQRQRLIYISVGLVIGGLSSSIVWLWRSKKKRAPSV